MKKELAESILHGAEPGTAKKSFSSDPLVGSAEKVTVKKITHITTVPISLNFLRSQVGYMKQRGFEVEAISSPGEALTAFGESQNIPVHAVELPRRITPFHDLKSVWNLSSCLLRIRPTIVHAHTPKGGLLGMIAAWITRTPIRIYHIHGFPYMTATGSRRRLLQWTERISSWLSTEVLCVSQTIRSVAIADRIVSAEKIKVLAGGSINGVDSDYRYSPDRFTPEEIDETRKSFGVSDDEIVVGFVGRIVRDKGIEELAEAWYSLRESHPKARLVLVGPIEPQDPVSPETLTRLQKDERVTMIAWVDDTSTVYPAFDILVLPTYREGFPNVPLEASSMGMPVVATNIPGCIDAVQDGVTGTLVPVRDSQALADSIRMYLDSPELRHQHGQAGRDRVLRDFRQEVIWEAVYQEYCRLMRQKGISIPVPLESPL